MDASRRQNNRKQYYVDGNTARQLSAVPAYQPERRERPDIRKPQTKRPAHRKVKRVASVMEQSIDLPMLFLLAVALMAMLYVCVTYLQIQADNTKMSKQIITLQSEVEEMKESNKDAKADIDAQIDLAKVYKRATKELGMVHASSDQIITFTSVKSDSVKQYDDIPEVKKENFGDKLAAFFKN